MEVLLDQVIESDGIREWFEKAPEVGDPDALFLALRLQEKVSSKGSVFGMLLPYPFSANAFFSREHLSLLLPCFKVLLDHSERRHILKIFLQFYNVKFNNKCLSSAITMIL